MMPCELRCVVTSPRSGFFADRSNVAASMHAASRLQLFGESAHVFCSVMKSRKSASLSGLV